MADHDHPYKLLFSHTEMVRDLLLTFVKEDWVSELDFTTLERRSGSFVSDDLRDRESDLIWSVRWGERRLYVYLLLEFQSTNDRFMAVRMMTYLGLLYQDLIRTGAVGADKQLPAVLPLVLYNGKPEWSAPADVRELIEDSPAGFARFTPSLRYFLVDELRSATSDLLAAPNPVSALFRLERSRTAQEVRGVLSDLLVWLRAPEQSGLRRDFTVWFSRTFLPGRTPGQTLPEFHELQEVDAMLSETVIEWTKQWKQEGLEQGLEKGLEQGLEKGREQGRAQERLELARRLLARGMNPLEVAELTGLSVPEVSNLGAK